MADKNDANPNEERFLGIERRLADLQKDVNSVLWTAGRTNSGLEKIVKSLIKIEDRILASK